MFVLCMYVLLPMTYTLNHCSQQINILSSNVFTQIRTPFVNKQDLSLSLYPDALMKKLKKQNAVTGCLTCKLLFTWGAFYANYLSFCIECKITDFTLIGMSRVSIWWTQAENKKISFKEQGVLGVSVPAKLILSVFNSAGWQNYSIFRMRSAKSA
jgi:hypothetical protein